MLEARNRHYNSLQKKIQMYEEKTNEIEEKRIRLNHEQSELRFNIRNNRYNKMQENHSKAKIINNTSAVCKQVK